METDILFRVCISIIRRCQIRDFSDMWEQAEKDVYKRQSPGEVFCFSRVFQFNRRKGI